jgi:hypothetical protein
VSTLPITLPINLHSDGARWTATAATLAGVTRVEGTSAADVLGEIGLLVDEQRGGAAAQALTPREGTGAG